MTTVHIVAPLSRRSAIARASVGLAAELAETCDVTFFAEATSDPLRSNVPVRAAAHGRLHDIAACDRLITVLGDSPHHAVALATARQTQSIVILHDVLLANLFVSMLPRAQIARLLTRHYSAPDAHWALQSLETLRPFCLGPDALRLPLFEPAIENAVGVVVHSSFAERHISAKTVAPVTIIPLAFRGASVAIQDRSIRSDELVLLTLGHANENKCHELVMEALALVTDIHVRYVIVGAISPQRRAHLKRHAASLGVSERVEITGHVSDAEVALLLFRSDVCVNLRLPALEGGSGSLVEQMAAGKPVVVFDHGCYMDAPDDACIKIAPTADAPHCADVLRRYLEDEGLRRQVGARAAQHAQSEHTFAAYARRLVEFFDVVDRAADAHTQLAAAVAAVARRWDMPPGPGLPQHWAKEMSSMLGMTT